MADIPASNWNETDTSNTTAAPDGAPEGMAPSGINNVLRAHQGAVKRWYKWTTPATTGGTSTAYTLSYTVAPGALVDGMTHLVQFNAANGLNPTLNVNALGSLPLHFYCGGSWAALPANMLGANQIVEVAYHSSSGAYRCLDLDPVLSQSVSAVSVIDFTGIPSNVNHLEIDFEVRLSTNNVGVSLRTYGADGVLDSGASDYSAWGTTIKSDNSSVVGGITTSSIGLGSGASNGSVGYGGRLIAQNIQAATSTKFQIHVSYLDQAGSLGVDVTGTGVRNEADRITGFRLFPSGGTFTGRCNVRMS